MSDASTTSIGKPGGGAGESWRLPKRGEHFINSVKQKLQKSEALESLSSSYNSGFTRFTTFLTIGCFAAIGIGFWGLSIGWTTYQAFQLRKSRYDKRILLLERRSIQGERILTRLNFLEDELRRPHTEEAHIRDMDAEIEELRLEISKNLPGIAIDDYYETRNGLLQHLDQPQKVDEWHKIVKGLLRTLKHAVAEYLAGLEDKQTSLVVDSSSI